MPINITVANRYSKPCRAIREANTTDIAAVDELIIPGLPVNVAAINPIITAVCKLIIGLTPATKANATDSGISASATVIPAKMSPLKYFLFLLNFSFKKPNTFVIFPSLSLSSLKNLFEQIEINSNLRNMNAYNNGSIYRIKSGYIQPAAVIMLRKMQEKGIIKKVGKASW